MVFGAVIPVMAGKQSFQVVDDLCGNSPLQDMGGHERRSLVQHGASIEHLIRLRQALDRPDDTFIRWTRYRHGVAWTMMRLRLGTAALHQELGEGEQRFAIGRLKRVEGPNQTTLRV